MVGTWPEHWPDLTFPRYPASVGLRTYERRMEGFTMPKCRGGSHHDKDWPGFPFDQRILVLFVRLPDGEQDFQRSETYIRDEPGGEWIIAHNGPKRPEDGSWYFA